MQIELAKMERMAQRGSSLLRLIQNSHTPMLDLLIRESVQNSLDATRGINTPIRYDISVKPFNRDKGSKHFDGITESLNARYKDEEQQSIVIRDSNTTGLTGPLHQDYIKDDSFGNLLKLVYEISMPQEKKEAGGSWGLGKTVYFRVGIGLVIYYSRIKLDDGTYQSRLAACLVEDESKEDSLLPNKNNSLKRGIAWWGQSHSEVSTKPLTNENQIKEILTDFNVDCYEGSETGTSIIIPFINSSKLIGQSEDNNSLWWNQDIELYLNIAMQRWYAPRINNNKYPYGNYLSPSINGREITKKNMEPVYSIIQSLYIATTCEISSGDSLYVDEKDIITKEIDLHTALKEKVAGKVAFIKVNKDILKMGVPDNKKSPYEYIDLPHTNDDSNPPIIMYLRKPAMIVNYETEGKWTNGIDHVSSDEFIIGIFTPNSNNIVTANEVNISLDEYIRQGEKADHSSWTDIVLGDRKHTIIDRIQKKVTSAIKQAYNQVENERNIARSGALSKSLASIFLPPTGYGSSPGGEPRGSTGDGNTSKKNSGKLNITNVVFGEENSLILDFEIKIPKKASLLDIEVQVESEGNKKIKGNDWEKESEIGTSFPVEIKNISLDFEEAENSDSSNVSINFSNTERFDITNKVVIGLEDYHGVLKGKLHLVNYDPMIQSYIQENIKTKEN